jgi:hypothetical protein
MPLRPSGVAGHLAATLAQERAEKTLLWGVDGVSRGPLAPEASRYDTREADQKPPQAAWAR